SALKFPHLVFIFLRVPMKEVLQMETLETVKSPPKVSKEARPRGERFGLFSVATVAIWVGFLLFLILPLLSLLLVGVTGGQVDILGAIFSSDIRADTFAALKDSSLSNITDVIGKPAYRAATLNSLKLSLLVAIVTTVMAAAIAYGLARTQLPLKRLTMI